MNVEDLRDYCLQKKGAVEDFPFGEETLVFKIGGKIFLLVGLDGGDRFNAKCDPERAIELREQHPEVLPGFHMNKKHWNTVMMNGGLKLSLLKEIIDHSYDLVLASLSKAEQARIAAIDTEL